MFLLFLALSAQAAEPPQETSAHAADAPVEVQPPAPPTAPPAPATEEQCTLAILDLEGGDAVSPARARAFSDVVTGEVSAHSKCAALSRSDIRGILSLEAEKQLLGCASDSCMAELAGALGADFLVTGTVSRIEGSMLLSLRMTNMRTMKVMRRATDSFAGDDADAIPFVAWLSRKLMTDDAQVIGPRPVATPKTAATTVTTPTVAKQDTIWRPIFWTSLVLTGVGGLVTAGAGGATIVMAEMADDDPGAAYSFQDIGPITADVANVALYTTAGLFVATTVLFFFPAEEEVKP